MISKNANPSLIFRSILNQLNTQRFYASFISEYRKLPKWERFFQIFWLIGPFVLLVERTPSDAWLTIIALSFLIRSAVKRDFTWAKELWVKLAFAFWGVCLISAVLSELPLSSLGEAAVWFRFPLFAMAIVFWLGTKREFVIAMLLSVGLGLIVMCFILALELALVGQVYGRLSWPYGDLVSGNYLAKVCLPTFLIMVALATSTETRLAVIMATIALTSIAMSLMAGERINFLIRACGGMLAAISWKPNFRRVVCLIVFEGLAVLFLMLSKQTLATRFVSQFIAQIPTHPESSYFQAMAPAWIAFKKSPLLGIGPNNLRFLCEELTAGSDLYACHPHPHNYYFQLLGETGLIGFLFGCLFIGSIILACALPAIGRRDNIIVATMWIVPFAFFWPIASTADFFGQWNNLFMWSAIALALAGSRVKGAIQ